MGALMVRSAKNQFQSYLFDSRRLSGTPPLPPRKTSPGLSHTEPAGDHATGGSPTRPAMGTENDPDSQCHALWDVTQVDNLQQLPAIFIRNHKRGGRSARLRSFSMGQSPLKVKLFLRHYTS